MRNSASPYEALDPSCPDASERRKYALLQAAAVIGGTTLQTASGIARMVAHAEALRKQRAEDLERACVAIAEHRDACGTRDIRATFAALDAGEQPKGEGNGQV